MNSKQLNFFLVPEDLPFVYDFFNRMDVRYIRVNNKEKEDVTLEHFPFRHGTAYEQICITHIDFSSNIYLSTWQNGEYFVDLEKSYVLQFTPGGFYPFSSHILNRGGFYCATSYFVSNGESVAKPDEFKKWVDKLFKSFKKEFLLVKLDERYPIFISQRAIEWMKNNGAVVDKAMFEISY